jgi:hypothetical protein
MNDRGNLGKGGKYENYTFCSIFHKSKTSLKYSGFTKEPKEKKHYSPA